MVLGVPNFARLADRSWPAGGGGAVGPVSAEPKVALAEPRS